MRPVSRFFIFYIKPSEKVFHGFKWDVIIAEKINILIALEKEYPLFKWQTFIPDQTIPDKTR